MSAGTVGQRLAAVTQHVPFSNGTEGEAWVGKWCEYCANDHGMHGMGENPPGCSIIADAYCHDENWRWPEAWLPEPDDGSFSLPSRLVCLAFTPCEPCGGDPGADGRAERVATVKAYWEAS